MENISETVLSIRLETIRDIGTDAKWQLLYIRILRYGIGKIMMETVLKEKRLDLETGELEASQIIKMQLHCMKNWDSRNMAHFQIT